MACTSSSFGNHQGKGKGLKYSRRGMLRSEEAEQAVAHLRDNVIVYFTHYVGNCHVCLRCL